uniref:Uncharacterized protein n=1 Tax=Fagus sylvatica TaxID=28930 RepID=A0A2N9H767_FAGSY
MVSLFSTRGLSPSLISCLTFKLHGRSSQACHLSRPLHHHSWWFSLFSSLTEALRHPRPEQELELPHKLILTLTEVFDLTKAPLP